MLVFFTLFSFPLLLSILTHFQHMIIVTRYPRAGQKPILELMSNTQLQCSHHSSKPFITV